MSRVILLFNLSLFFFFFFKAKWVTPGWSAPASRKPTQSRRPAHSGQPSCLSTSEGGGWLGPRSLRPAWVVKQDACQTTSRNQRLHPAGAGCGVHCTHLAEIAPSVFHQKSLFCPSIFLSFPLWLTTIFVHDLFRVSVIFFDH